MQCSKLGCFTVLDNKFVGYQKEREKKKVVVLEENQNWFYFYNKTVLKVFQHCSAQGSRLAFFSGGGGRIFLHIMNHVCLHQDESPPQVLKTVKKEFLSIFPTLSK